MAVTNLGRVVPLYKGTYSAAAQYTLNDIVAYSGKVYWHTGSTPTTGVAPTNTTVWTLMVEPGALPSTANLIAGDGSGGSADSGLDPSLIAYAGAAQTLTDGQKTQARTNIGAAAQADISAVEQRVGKTNTGTIDPGVKEGGFYQKSQTASGYKLIPQTGSPKRYMIDVSDYIGYAITITYSNTASTTNASSGLVEDPETMMTTDDRSAMEQDAIDGTFALTVYPSTEYHWLAVSHTAAATNLSITYSTEVEGTLKPEILDAVAKSKRSAVGVGDFIWRLGSVNAQTAQEMASTTSVRCERMRVNAGVTIHAKTSSNKFAVYVYKDAENHEVYESRSMGKTAYTTAHAGYLVVVASADDQEDITETPLTYADGAVAISGYSPDSKSISKLDLSGIESDYYRRDKVEFGRIPASWYHAETSHFELGRYSTCDEIIAAMDDMAQGSGGYMSKSVIGHTDDGEYDIYMYDLNPNRVATPNAIGTRYIPKIIVTTMHHGEEKIPLLGWMETIYRLINEPWDDEVLTYLRTQVRILYIPIVNPYGYDNHVRANANGVDINRNYPAGWTSETGEGDEPLDQGESAAVASVLNSNRDAVLYIDNHGNGSVAVSEAINVNWISLNNIRYGMMDKIADAMITHNAKITVHFSHDYSMPYTTQIGKVTSNSGDAMAKGYAASLGIPALTVEGSNGISYPEDESQKIAPYTDEARKYNSEISVNAIMEALNALA